ncbi:DUF317 domain-containing protein [Streptomyces chromofuscus]|uniref:DUF317 domain-containing protein n=1 Tax=Streptomyces chromofuscus TaxID=42881 RepID=A0A7M2T3X2_STRCW|nr:DUF317 domain-containing protein [Streptomyces chromofuscus]QOV42984.1 DUF317 domain-containing protein [Streptomyces chromofuscus]GGS92712.1 hypothetical protein GCM10010254_10790 [Streptomyces chromofuscus]
MPEPITPDDPHTSARDLLVSPVYLAGPGNPTVVTRPLHAAGWAEARTPAGRMFSSPCLRAQIADLPDGWTISYAREPLAVPHWTAHFTRDTPAEIVSAFTTTLVCGLPDDHRDHRPGGPHHTLAGPGDVLIARGWRDDHSSLFHYQHAPDGHAYLRLNLGEADFHTELEGEVSAAWTLYARVEAVNGPRWYADFTSRTPVHLITATADAFSRPDPVRRRPRDLPKRHLPFLTVRSAAARTHAHAARATARSSASAVPVARTPAHMRLANPTRSRR